MISFQFKQYFSNKMNKYREPFRERGNIYDQDQPSKISYKHQLDPFSCPRQKQDLPEYLKTMDRKTANQPINISFNDNTKHTTSQMTTDDAIFRQKYGQKNANLYRVYENLFDERSQRVSQQQYKKNNAKHMEIESKISKIQSFHQKIENLLDMVKVGSKTPQRQRKQMGVSPSRSISKISTPISKGKTDRNKQQALEPFRPFRQQLRSRFTCQQINQKDTQRMKSQIHEPSENKNYQMQKQKDIYRITAKSQSELKYNQRDISRRNRDKSKQYMKTIEGEVKDIQNTIQILNQKIQKVDNLPFKRQIHFDDLSTSNPESLYLIREGSNFEKAFQNRRRTYDLSHQKKIHTQNLKHSQHQLDPKKNTKNTSDNLKVLGQESFLQREQNQASRGLRLKRYENSSNRRQGDYNHHLVPNVNPYDASIQPSEQENLNNGYNYKFKRNLQKGQSMRCARKE